MPVQKYGRNGRRALAAAVCVACWGIPGHAATSTWSAINGNWSVAGNWNPSGAPLSGTVLIANTDSTNRVVTFDEASTVSLAGLTLDNSGGGTDSLSMTSTGLSLASATEFIGNSSSSTLTGSGALVQSVGSNTISSALYMAFGADDTGTYSLSGPAGTQMTAGNENIGYGGTASFVQSGGTNTDNGGFGLGVLANSNGSYALSGGTLVANAGEAIGEGGIGNLVQSGGTHTIASGNLNLGFSGGAVGSYTLSAGAANVTSGNVNIGGNASGPGGKGNLIITGTGVLTTSSTATINVYNTSGSALTLSGGTINTGSLNLVAGNPALFNWTSGTLNWNNAVNFAIIDNTSFANLASTLSLGPTQTLNVAGDEADGYNAAGVVNQSGGMNSTAYLYIAAATSISSGTYTLSGSGTLNAPDISVGYNGTGTLTQSGGTVNSSGFITLGDQTHASGTYNLNGGVINGTDLNLGYNNAAIGTFNHTGGAATFTSVVLGQGSGASGVYMLSDNGLGGVSQLQISGNETIGNAGSGTFTHSGGQSTVGGSLILGNSSGSSGSYTLSANGSLAVAQNEYVGYGGTGNFTQSGGANTASLGLNLGQTGGSSGTYTLSGAGSLNVPNNSGTLGENVGNSGTGIFNQSGGTNTVGYILTLGNSTGSSGTYNLSGSGVLSVTNAELIGGSGTGTFNQTGGFNNAGLELFVGGGDTGTYSLSGTGVLSVSGFEFLGENGPATFNQSGGTQKTVGTLLIGGDDSAVLNLSGGSASATTATVGLGNTEGAPGTLNISSTGTLNVTGVLAVSTNGSTLNFTGGTINTGALNFNGIPSLFNWTGGTLNITTSVTWDSAAAGNSTSDAFTSSLSIGAGQTLMVTGNETLGGAGPFSLTLNNGSTHYVTGAVTLGPTGTITQNNGSTLYDSSFTQAGGTINGTLQNQSQFIYQSGAFNGRLLNQGTVSLGPSFTAGNGIQNNATISLTAGQAVTVNGAGLENLGTLNLNDATLFANGSGVDNLGTMILTGGTISGSGSVTNDYSGTLQGNGIINPALTNNGNLNVAGVLQLNNSIANFGVVQGNGEIVGNFSNTNGGSVIVPSGNSLAFSNPWTNSSLVTLQGSGAVLGGGAINNTGTIDGAGTINSPISNTTGVIRASGGELDLGGAGDTNGAAAQVQSSTGNTVLVVQGLATNAGLIALAGGTFDNNNKPMSNTGTISGNGILRTGNLTNASAGLVLFTNENSTVYGSVTNAAGGNIKIVSNTTTFYGPVTNNGTINVTNGVATFLGNGVSMTVGGTYTSDPSANYFNGLSTTPTGLISGGAADQFILTDGSTFTNAGTFTNPGTLTANAVTNSGTFTQTGTLNASGNFSNSGTTTIAGTQNWSAGAIFTNTTGLTTLQTDAGSATSSPLSVNITGGKIALQSPQHWATLSISGNGTLDVANNHVVIDYAGGPDPISSVVAYLTSGYAGGTWSGPGIVSSTAATTTGYSLGYADAADAGNPAGLSSGTIEIKYTLLGDANLDGAVNGVDFGILAANFNKGVTGWDKGDFNYDNAVNGVDFGELAANFNKGASGASVESALSDPALVAFAQANGLMADLPEPASAAIPALAVIGSLTHRRRVSRHSQV